MRTERTLFYRRILVQAIVLAQLASGCALRFNFSGLKDTIGTCNSLEQISWQTLVQNFTQLSPSLLACAQSRWLVSSGAAPTTTAHYNSLGTWSGIAVSAQDGLIYYFPVSGGNIRSFDPKTNTVVTSGYGAIADTPTAAVQAFNGKIYVIPDTSDIVSIFDPVSKTVDTTTLTGVGASGIHKWYGAVLAPNGKIYAGPKTVSNVLIIDTLTDTADTTTLSGLPITGYWYPVLAPNGKIFFTPDSTIGASLLMINPANDTYSYVGSFPTWDYSNGAALGPDGKVYFAGWSLYQFDPDTYTKVTLPGSTGSVSTTAMTFGPDGRVYANDANGNNYYYVYDFLTQTHQEIALSGTTSAVLPMVGSDQNIYFVDASGDLIQMNVSPPAGYPDNLLTSRIFR